MTWLDILLDIIGARHTILYGKMKTTMNFYPTNAKIISVKLNKIYRQIRVFNLKSIGNV